MIKATQSSQWRSNMKLRDVWKLSMILFAALFVGCSTAEDVGYPPMTQEQAQAFFDQYSELLMAGDLEGAWGVGLFEAFTAVVDDVAYAAERAACDDELPDLEHPVLKEYVGDGASSLDDA